MIVLFTALLATQPMALADEGEPKKGPFEVVTHGELRLVGTQHPDFVVDTLGNTVGQDAAFDSRLRAQLTLQSQDWGLQFEGDAFNGQFAGDTWDLAGDEDARHREQRGIVGTDSFTPRRATLSGRIGPTRLEAGLNSSHWGLGLLSNDGNHDNPFGRNDLGDRQIRIKLSTQAQRSNGGKLPFFFAIAADRVVEDDLARLALEQEARQFLGSFLFMGKGDTRIGLLVVGRQQLESDLERLTKARILDLHAEHSIPIGEAKLKMAAEVARITGITSRSQSYNSRYGLWVGALGAATEMTLMLPEERLAFDLRAGYASGDGNPDDNRTQEFRFDHNYNVGSVLFDELMGSIEVASYNRITDPSIAGQGPDGIEVHVSEGAVRSATYLQPMVRYRPLPWLETRLGAVMAWSTAPIAEPFNTYRNGGVPTNHLGQTTEDYRLGTEYNWAVELGEPNGQFTGLGLSPQLLVQGGHLMANENLGGEQLHLIMATGRVRW